jgi:hypothetical protein
VPIIAHDWWTYQVVSGYGGQVGYDPRPSLKYRQHRNNIIGANRGVKAALRRIRRLCKGEFKLNIACHLQALEDASSILSPEPQEILALFKKARNHAIWCRLKNFLSSGVYRQNRLDHTGLVAAVLFNKM